MNTHTYEPDFDANFYKKQNEMMEERYAVLFKRAGLSWFDYISKAQSRLENKTYWMWIFLCGFESFLKKNNNLRNKDKFYLKKAINKDAEDRIFRIIGDTNKIKEYIESLPKKEI